MNIRMMNDRIAVRENKPGVVSAGGIYIGEQIDDGLVKEIVSGTVLAVGPGARLPNGARDTMWGLQPGQTVRFSPVMSHKEVIDGEEIRIIRRDSVVGVLE
jgi:co-chaperonin GroES (HSP10)